jgi:hypothetical protein
MSMLSLKHLVLRWIFPGILPIMLLLAGIGIYRDNGYFYLRNADPEYHYLMSSVALGGGSIQLNTLFLGLFPLFFAVMVTFADGDHWL